MTDHDERRTPLPGENRQGWMMFRYGGPLQLLELTPEQVDVRDIIHGLGQINRFNGQSARPIPVLWHSLMVMQLCAAHDPATSLEALFHDAGSMRSSGLCGVRPAARVNAGDCMERYSV